MNEQERQYKASYTRLDRFRVQIGLAEMALKTAQRMLKRQDDQERLEAWIEELAAFKIRVPGKDLWAKWR